MSDGGGGDGGGDGGLADFFWGTSNSGRSTIPHYYGDSVRQLLLGAAALMIIFSPLYSDVLRQQFPFIIIGALLAAAFAALMNPRDKWVVLGSAIVSGTGLVIYAMWGMYGYKSIDPVAFMLRVAVAVIFLFAFYFSMKTLRAFMMHQVGKRETIDEFEETDVKIEQEMLERERILEERERRGK
ncbi:hypothetical protein EXS56_01170 [Candidatus Kaiserbacteria bacterium]|nr:hypothetical protein [Candidatus Kaiserbacteria bacterium]